MKTVLFNPFQRYSETILLSAGVAITLFGSLLAFIFSARFDGIFNVGNLMKDSTEALMNSIVPGEVPDISISNLIPVLLFAALSIVFLIWYMALLFNGFKVANNAKGTKPIVLFILVILVAEVVSKFTIFKLV